MTEGKVKINLAYVVYAKVTEVTQHTRRRYVTGFGESTVFATEPDGYFMYLEGSHEAVRLGFEPPDITAGDTMKITFQKVDPR